MTEPEQGMLGREGSRESCATNKSVEGCILELVTLANSPFEKKAVVELASLEAKMKEELANIKTNIKWVKWLIIGVFAVIVLNIILNKL